MSRRRCAPRATRAEIMVIGGAELFRAFLPRAGRIHLTRVHGNIAGDVIVAGAR